MKDNKDEGVEPFGRVTTRRSEQGVESVRQSSLKPYPLGMTFVKGEVVGSVVEQGRGGDLGRGSTRGSERVEEERHDGEVFVPDLGRYHQVATLSTPAL